MLLGVCCVYPVLLPDARSIPPWVNVAMRLTALNRLSTAEGPIKLLQEDAWPLLPAYPVPFRQAVSWSSSSPTHW